jgi:hypothetical protein
MGELTTNRQWDAGSKDSPSQYARMIPGTSALLPSRSAPPTSAPAADATSKDPVNAIDETNARHAPVRPLAQPHRTQPGIDRFTLCELVAADFIVLVTVCGALSLFFPAWGLPWPYLPIFAVLVTLFGLSEGIYKHAGIRRQPESSRHWQGQPCSRSGWYSLLRGTECALSPPPEYLPAAWPGWRYYAG